MVALKVAFVVAAVREFLNDYLSSNIMKIPRIELGIPQINT
jgi:hypothetical protein